MRWRGRRWPSLRSSPALRCCAPAAASSWDGVRASRTRPGAARPTKSPRPTAGPFPGPCGCRPSCCWRSRSHPASFPGKLPGATRRACSIRMPSRRRSSTARRPRCPPRRRRSRCGPASCTRPARSSRRLPSPGSRWGGSGCHRPFAAPSPPCGRRPRRRCARSTPGRWAIRSLGSRSARRSCAERWHSDRVCAMPGDEISARVERLELPFDARGVDGYGTSKWHLGVAFRALSFLYRTYFQVRCQGLEHIPVRGRAMLVGNHSGGIALDAAMVIAACFLELDPPRLAQGMAEKFINRFPFASTWTSRCGQLTGLPEHAQRLLEDDRLLMVFPEGARGTAKLWKDRWSLVDFGTGFIRLALRTKSPIVPLGFIGGGDAIPTVSNLYRIGKLVGVPYVPVTPWIFPVPRPVRLEIHYGEPLVFEGNGSEEDDVIQRYVEQVKSAIAGLIEKGRESRRGRLKGVEP